MTPVRHCALRVCVGRTLRDLGIFLSTRYNLARNESNDWRTATQLNEWKRKSSDSVSFDIVVDSVPRASIVTKVFSHV